MNGIKKLTLTLVIFVAGLELIASEPRFCSMARDNITALGSRNILLLKYQAGFDQAFAENIQDETVGAKVESLPAFVVHKLNMNGKNEAEALSQIDSGFRNMMQKFLYAEEEAPGINQKHYKYHNESPETVARELLGVINDKSDSAALRRTHETNLQHFLVEALRADQVRNYLNEIVNPHQNQELKGSAPMQPELVQAHPNEIVNPYQKYRGLVAVGLISLTAAEWYWIVREYQASDSNSFMNWLWENKTNPKVLAVVGLTTAQVGGICWLYKDKLKLF